MKKMRFFDLVTMILSIYVLISLLIDSFFKLSNEVSRLLSIIDDIICFVFLYDFAYRFWRAPSKLNFMKWGWIDFISSIPTFEYLRYGRVVRLIRLFRVLRAFRSVKYLTAHIFKTRIQGTFSAVFLLAMLMMIFGSIAILQVETSPESNIKTAEDSIWWAFTVTSVGYGDRYPVTTEGRIIAGFLMITGICLFGTFAGFVASWFMEDKLNKMEEHIEEHKNKN